MLAEKSLSEGNLKEALAQLQDQVRKDPSKAEYRTFLFQLLCVIGNWDRAITQLNVASEMDTDALVMAQTYREVIQCEVFREDVFAGKRSPVLFGEPQQWVALMLEALRLTAEGKHAESQALRNTALEQAPATSGTINEQAFEWIADADSRLGPILEAIVNGRYYWIPMHLIKTIQIDEPADLRDIVWLPANFTWANGGETVGLIPTRYPGSENSDDPLICMSRKTDWITLDSESYQGIGQRMFTTDSADYPLMDIREIHLNTEALLGESEASATEET